MAGKRKSERHEAKRPPVRFGQPISKGPGVFRLGPAKPKAKHRGGKKGKK
jgi:hypothetical protein